MRSDIVAVKRDEGGESQMSEKNERVLIVGAGPVGLVAAASLAEAGIPVTIIERSDVCTRFLIAMR